MQQSASPQYILEEVLLTADRLEGLETIDIGPLINELELYENIEKPYITGSITFLDSAGVSIAIGGFKGTERLQIKIKVYGADNISPLVKNFIVTGVESSVKNERTELILLHFIEEHAYMSNARRIRESIQGPTSRALKSVFQGQLNRTLETPTEVFNDSKVVDRNILVNYGGKTPLELIEYIRERYYTDNGAPIFIYSSLQNNNLIMGDFETMVSQIPWNSSIQDYTITASQQGEGIPAVIQKVFGIQDLKRTGSDSTFELISNGAGTSITEVFDVNTGQFLPIKIDGLAHINNLIATNVLPNVTVSEAESNFNVDREVKSIQPGITQNAPGIVTGIKATEMVSRYQAINSLSYLFSPSGENIEVGAELPAVHSINAIGYRQQLQARIVRLMMMRFMYKIVVPGAPYIARPDATVGSTIKLSVAMTGSSSTSAARLDPDKSGRYLIYRIKHRFVSGKHTAHIDGVKLTRTIEDAQP